MSTVFLESSTWCIRTVMSKLSEGPWTTVLAAAIAATGEGGGVAYTFVAGLGHWTIDHALLSRRSSGGGG